MCVYIGVDIEFRKQVKGHGDAFYGVELKTKWNEEGNGNKGDTEIKPGGGWEGRLEEGAYGGCLRVLML